jgi:hypothetical protein
MSDVMQDAQVVLDYWFAIVLAYAGCELYKIRDCGTVIEFTVLCPRFDFESYKDEYDRGLLQIADAKSFGESHRRVSRIVKEARRTGEWKNPDYEYLEEEMARN